MAKDPMKGYTVIIHDTETTGTAEEDRIIESAYIKIKDGKVEFKEGLNQAPLPVKPAAAMTHGYRNSMLVGLPQFIETEQYTDLKALSETDAIYIAHNAEFDLTMLAKEGIKWNPNVIDTLRVAHHLYGEDERVEMFKLQYFRYLFEWDDQEWFPKFMAKVGVDEIKPHTALSDILILWIFVEQMIKEFKITLEDMIELSKKPVLEQRINFGQIFQKKVTRYDEIVKMTYQRGRSDVPGYEYLQWALNNMDNLSIDTRYSVSYAMAYGVLNKDIPMTREYQPYLKWGIAFAFNKEEINKALEMQGEGPAYIARLKEEVYEKKRRLELVAYEKEIPLEKDILTLKQYEFLLNYFARYREAEFLS